MSWILTPEQRSGILVAIISGGRPKLSQRPTRRLLTGLREYGVQDVVWVVRETHAHDYEHDPGAEICTYTESWAYDYASDHWMHLDAPQRGGFFGAFPGREWAALEAERRGCWAVLQLDDNITRLTAPRHSSAGRQLVVSRGGMALYTDLLGATALSTNGWMVGAALGSVPRVERTVARPGFPYSLFLERVGVGRELWYGPFEDDITHALQYGSRPDGAAPLLLPLIKYIKSAGGKTGMRGNYDATRAVQLQRLFPEAAKINVRSTSSNGRGKARVFHTMSPDAIRNPLQVHDVSLFGRVQDTLRDLVVDWQTLQVESNRDKVRARTNPRT